MRVVWRIGHPAPAREVHHHVVREHDVAIHTVITVLNKLVRKGLLRREKLDDLLHYSTPLTAEEFLTQASRQVVVGILSLGPEAVTASFIDVLAENDPRQLEELAELITDAVSGLTGTLWGACASISAGALSAAPAHTSQSA